MFLPPTKHVNILINCFLPDHSTNVIYNYMHFWTVVVFVTQLDLIDIIYKYKIRNTNYCFIDNIFFCR